MKLANKVAIITGAGSGMGRASACLFAREGAKVSVVDINIAGGQETVGLIKRSGGVAQFINADVAKASDVERMVKQLLMLTPGLIFCLTMLGSYEFHSY